MISRTFIRHASQASVIFPKLVRKELSKEAAALYDNHGRFHDYLRISLVEKCNLACRYCVPDEEVHYSPKDELLNPTEIQKLAKTFVEMGVTKIRLTGGEPTIRSDLVNIIESLNDLRSIGLKEIAMTTNGIVLNRRLELYKAAGLDSVNISLDTLVPDKFRDVSGLNGLGLVLKGIFKALELGFDPVKLNVVVMAGVNENEIANFIELTREHPLDIRFLEFMPFSGNKWSRDKMVAYKTMFSIVKKLYPGSELTGNKRSDTAKSFVVPGYRGKFGFITSMSNNFCGGCNRLRITADGHLKACLFGENELNLKNSLRQGISDSKLTNLISDAVKRKAPRHAGMDLLQTLKNRPMILIGGKRKRFRKVFQSKFLTMQYLRTQSRRFFCSQPGNLQEVEAIRMATVSGKMPTHRTAKATATVSLPENTFRMIVNGQLPKVTSLETLVAAVQLAGVNAAKLTPSLLPLCHPIPISVVDIKVHLNNNGFSFVIESSVTADSAVTGVEMEALVSVNISALTLYDLAKSAGSQNILIHNVKLLHKSGGKSDYFCNH